jgi:glycine dehydrogenase
MIEPTESEDKYFNDHLSIVYLHVNRNELDRLAQALLKIREEIRKIENGEWPQDDNPLKNSPHTETMIICEEWKHPYSREEAAFPLGKSGLIEKNILRTLTCQLYRMGS